MVKKNYKKNYTKKDSEEAKKTKAVLRQKRLYKYTPTIFNFKYLFIEKSLSAFNLKIYIRIRSNNIFCTLIELSQNKILLNISSGKYKIQTSKKKLKYNVKIILETFFKDIRKYLKQQKNILIELIAAIRIRKHIIKFLNKNLKKKNLILHTQEKKCFNGCRPAKKRRKKRLRLQILK